MNTSDRIDFISELELEYPQEEFRFRKTRSLRSHVELLAKDKDQTFLTDKSIVSFVSQVGGQNRKDILNSLLLAQMAANKRYPDEKHLLEWCNFVIEVLSGIGWNIETKGFVTWKSSKNIVEVENVVIDILTAAFGSTYIVIIKKMLESLKNLSDGNNKIQVFEKNSHALTKGCFQIALAVEVNDTVTIHLGAFILTSTNEIDKILFFKFDKNTTKLEYTSNQGTLNTELYSQVRDKVMEKLGSTTRNYIAEIDI